MLSLGSRGAVGATECALIEAVPPRVDVLCPIGAGDAMAAAFAWSMERTQVRGSGALGRGGGNGVGLPARSAYRVEGQAQEVYKQVEVRRIE